MHQKIKSLYVALGMAVLFFIPTYYAAVLSNSLVVWLNAGVSIIYIITLLSSIYVLYYKNYEKQLQTLIKSFFVILLIGIYFQTFRNITNLTPIANPTFSLYLMVFYALINIFMWLWTKREAKLHVEHTLLAHSKIFATKLAINIIIFSSLFIGHNFPDVSWSIYADPFGALIISIVIFLNYRSLLDSSYFSNQRNRAQAT